MPKARNVYLDTNAIIHFAEGEEKQLELFFIRAVAEGIRFFTSELTLAEVLVIPIRERDAFLADCYEQALRTDEALTVVAVDRTVLRRSAELRAHFGGHGMDAIHIATADLSACEVIISSDKGLRLPEGMERVPVDEVEAIGTFT